MKFALASLLCLALPLMAAESMATIDAALPRTISASAAALPEARGRLMQFARSGMGERIGIGSTERAAALDLVSPLPVYWVPYDVLTAYTRDRDPAEIMVDAREVLYLAAMNRSLESVVSAVLVRETDAGWGPVMFGYSNTARSIATAQLMAMSRGVKEARFFLRIRALNVSFLAFQRGGELLLIALENNSLLGIEARETAPARDIFMRLIERSREMNLDDAS